MRRPLRFLVVPAVMALVLLTATGHSTRTAAGLATPRVVIVDNDGTFQPGDAATGMWGYAPAHIGVTKGEKITFDNPASNNRPHAITSISWTGNFAERKLESATQFDSSPTREALITPGNSFVLDTAEMNPGHYLYYCSIHPWMVGSFTVSAAQ